jgi:hypothetical protein
MNSNASIICQSHHNQIYKVQHQKGSRSLASKCPQRISGLSAPERDVTKKNLILVSTITDQNLKVEFFKNYSIVKDLLNHIQTVAIGVREGGLYKLDVTRKAHHALTYATMPTKILWHQRYGHINHPDLLLLQKKNMVEGLPMLKNEKFACDGCASGNMHRDEFPSNPDKKKRDVLDFVHDVYGPM